MRGISAKARILMLPGSYTSPSARFRMWQLIKPLEAEGYEVTARVPCPDRVGKSRGGDLSVITKISPRFAQAVRLTTALLRTCDAHRFDVVFANRDIVPEPRIRLPERRLFLRGARLVFDFDDAIHLGKRQEKAAWIVKNAGFVTPGNEELARFARQHSDRVRILPTVVNTDLYAPGTKRVPGPLRIGWSGSESTNRFCLPLLREPIMELSTIVDFEFVVISNKDPQVNWEGVHTRFSQWSPETEVSNLQLLDIGLMPLQDNEFERGKCGLKAIQYMALRIPAIVSPVGVNRGIVTHGEDGFHANTVEDWVRFLRLLAEDDELRGRLGCAARKRVEKDYSHRVAVNILNDVFQKVIQ